MENLTIHDMVTRVFPRSGYVCISSSHWLVCDISLRSDWLLCHVRFGFLSGNVYKICCKREELQTLRIRMSQLVQAQ